MILAQELIACGHKLVTDASVASIRILIAHYVTRPDYRFEQLLQEKKISNENVLPDISMFRFVTFLILELLHI